MSLVLSIEEISLRPARFRIQGGYPEHDGRTKDREVQRTEICLSNIGFICFAMTCCKCVLFTLNYIFK